MTPIDPAEFDQHAESYDAQVERGLKFSGERKEYFAGRRVDWMAPLLRRHGVAPRRVLDYGCGTGTALPLLHERLAAGTVIGVDVSEQSLDVARRMVMGTDASIELTPVAAGPPDPPCDLAYTCAVFHHIRPPDRAAALDYLYRAVRPGGLLAFWEHNPWNPGTQLVVWRVPLDRDAILLRPSEARRRIRAAGFEPLETHFLFLFPRLLRPLRTLEPPLARWPLGAQYLVLARRP